MSLSSPRMFNPGIYAVCDDSVRPQMPLIEKAEALVAGEMGVIQLRLKNATLAAWVESASAIGALCRKRHVRFLINDRVDVAMISGADGVHLGEDDLPVEQARALLGPDALIGATVRDLTQAQKAFRQGADYVGLGPIFSTQTKTVNASPLGLDGLKAVCHQSPVPVVAISGITLANVAQVAACGSYGAAIISDLLMADDIPHRAREMKRRFAAASAHGFL